MPARVLLMLVSFGANVLVHGKEGAGIMAASDSIAETNSVVDSDAANWLQMRIAHEAPDNESREALWEEKVEKSLDSLQEAVKSMAVEVKAIHTEYGQIRKDQSLVQTNPNDEALKTLATEQTLITNAINSIDSRQGAISTALTGIKNEQGNLKTSITQKMSGVENNLAQRQDVLWWQAGKIAEENHQSMTSLSGKVGSVKETVVNQNKALSNMNSALAKQKDNSDALSKKLDGLAYAGNGAISWTAQQRTALAVPTAEFVTAQLWGGWSKDDAETHTVETKFIEDAKSCWEDGDASRCHAMMDESTDAMNGCWDANAKNAEMRAEEARKTSIFGGIMGIVGGLGSAIMPFNPASKMLMRGANTMAAVGGVGTGIASGMQAGAAGKYPDLSDTCLQQGQYAMMANQRALLKGQELLMEGQQEILEGQKEMAEAIKTKMDEGFDFIRDKLAVGYTQTMTAIKNVASDISELKDSSIKAWNSIRAGQGAIMAGLASLNMKLDKVLKKLDGVDAKLDAQEFSRLDRELHSHASVISGAATTVRDLLEIKVQKGEHLVSYLQDVKTSSSADTSSTSNMQDSALEALADYFQTEGSTWSSEHVSSLLFSVRDAFSQIETVLLDSRFLEMHFTLISANIVSCANGNRESAYTSAGWNSLIPPISVSACTDDKALACNIRQQCDMPAESEDVCFAMKDVLSESHVMNGKPVTICKGAFTQKAMDCTRSIMQYLISEKAAGALLSFLEDTWLEAFFVAEHALPKTNFGTPDYLSRAGTLNTIFKSYDAIGNEVKRLKDKFATTDVAQTMVESIWDTLIPLLCPVASNCIASSIANFEEAHTSELFIYDLIGYSLSEGGVCTTGKEAISDPEECEEAKKVMGVDASCSSMCVEKKRRGNLMARAPSDLLRWPDVTVNENVGASYICRQLGRNGIDIVDVDIKSVFGQECSAAGAGEFDSIALHDLEHKKACETGGKVTGIFCGWGGLCKSVGCQSVVHGEVNMNNWAGNSFMKNGQTCNGQAPIDGGQATNVHYQTNTPLNWFTWWVYEGEPNCLSVWYDWWEDFVERKCGSANEAEYDVNDQFCSQQRDAGAQFLTEYKLKGFHKETPGEDDLWIAHVYGTCFVPVTRPTELKWAKNYDTFWKPYKASNTLIERQCLCPPGNELELKLTYQWAEQQAKTLNTRMAELLGEKLYNNDNTQSLYYRFGKKDQYKYIVRDRNGEPILLEWNCGRSQTWVEQWCSYLKEDERNYGKIDYNCVDYVDYEFTRGCCSPLKGMGERKFKYFNWCDVTTDFSVYEDKFPLSVYDNRVHKECGAIDPGKDGAGRHGSTIMNRHNQPLKFPRQLDVSGGIGKPHGSFTDAGKSKTQRYTDNWGMNPELDSHTIQVQCDYTQAKQMEQVNVSKEFVPEPGQLEISPLVMADDEFDDKAEAMASADFSAFFNNFCAAAHWDPDDCDNCTRANYDAEIQKCNVPSPCIWKCPEQ